MLRYGLKTRYVLLENEWPPDVLGTAQKRTDTILLHGNRWKILFEVTLSEYGLLFW